jgi:hypothetical protein
MSAPTAPVPAEAPIDAATTDAAPKAPLVVRLVDQLGRALSGRSFGRRRFLTRVAVVGAAVAVDPIRFAFKPGTAYAQVCGDGASCGSGWTAFCCTVNNGANTCPPGSFVAGWWRIDDSPFCLGQARYVIDCNRSPGSSCSCRCASGSCDQRRVCCNNFRYGQCNTQIPGVTEVVCRVVTCTAPWDWDPACSRTQRVDNRTRSHNAPCLPGRDATPIAIRYQDLGMTGSILGAPSGNEQAVSGGRRRRYANGTIYWRAATGALAVHGAVDELHRSLGAQGGALGFPLTELRGTGDGTGLEQRFQRGTIYRRTSSAAPVAVIDPIDQRYRTTEGGPRGAYRYPLEASSRSDGSRLVRFEGGTLVHVTGNPVVRVRPDVLQAATSAPSSSPDRVGWPTAEETTSGGARFQRFERGVVTQTIGGTLLAIGDDLASIWLANGGPGGAWGRPRRAPRTVAGGRGRELALANATLYVGAGTGTRVLAGPVLSAYEAEGGPDGSLGLPTSDVITLSNGQRRASFEGGAIVIEPGGSVSVVRRRDGRSPSELSRRTPDGRAPRRGYTPEDLT